MLYRKQGLTSSKIGKLIGRSTPTITREIKRNS
ncbi:helix-turn-helix domain-containing protein, partial [Enterococcus faecalis]|nr:helix-turn-helix domain-containing protein [Enterococcus faecalis]